MVSYIWKDKGVIENTVKVLSKTAARVNVPLSWLGKRCEVRLLEEKKPVIPQA